MYIVAKGGAKNGATEGAPAVSRLSGKATVYVVDDDPDMLTAVSRLIRSVGLDVATFPSAQAFLEMEPSARAQGEPMASPGASVGVGPHELIEDPSARAPAFAEASAWPRRSSKCVGSQGEPKASPGASGAKSPTTKQPDDVSSCLVLDVSLPGPSGLDLQEALQRQGREIPIIFITGHGTVPSTVRALKAGAVDFLEKPFSDEALLGAIRAALDRDEKTRAESWQRATIRLRFDKLTPREREVMALVVRGQLNKQIAAELGVAETTVKVHRGRVMAKMEAQSVPDLVRMAQKIRIPTSGESSRAYY